MKKEKKRELTLEQLEKRKSIANKISSISLLIAVVGCVIIGIVTITIIRTLGETGAVIFLIIYLIHAIFWSILSISTNKISSVYKKQISLKKKAIKVTAIKEKLKEGDLKKSVILKNEDIITDILSKGVVKIVTDEVNETDLIVSIQLDDYTWQCDVRISRKDLISILDEYSKKEMMDYLINYIKVENLEEKMQIEISGPGYLWTNKQATDDDLFEMFELKE